MRFMSDIIERLRAAADVTEEPGEFAKAWQPAPEMLREAAAEIEAIEMICLKLSRIGIALNRRVADLERDLSIEVAAGHAATERAEAAERELNELRAKWKPLVTWAAAKERTEQDALSGKEET